MQFNGTKCRRVLWNLRVVIPDTAVLTKIILLYLEQGPSVLSSLNIILLCNVPYIS